MTPHLCRNARLGARSMRETRRAQAGFIRDRARASEPLPWRVRTVYVWFPRVAFHWNYLRTFGLRHWLRD